MKKLILILMAVCLISGGGLIGAFGAENVYVSWNANSESDLAGYKLYYDVDSGEPYSGTYATQGASPIDIPLNALNDAASPTFILAVPDGAIFGAVTAYDQGGNESDFSNEATTIVDGPPVTPGGCAFSNTPPE